MSEPTPPSIKLFLSAMVLSMAALTVGLGFLTAHFSKDLGWMLFNSERAVGRVVDLHFLATERFDLGVESANRRTSNRIYQVEFETKDGAKVQITANGADADTRQFLKGINKEVGDTVPILYNRERPSHAVRLAWDETWCLGTITSGTFCLVFGLATLWLASRVYRRPGARASPADRGA